MSADETQNMGRITMFLSSYKHKLLFDKRKTSLSCLYVVLGTLIPTIFTIDNHVNINLNMLQLAYMFLIYAAFRKISFI